MFDDPRGNHDLFLFMKEVVRIDLERLKRFKDFSP
jgi:hypothetical protein